MTLSATRRRFNIGINWASVISFVMEPIDRLSAKRFRVSPLAWEAVLKLAGEEDE